MDGSNSVRLMPITLIQPAESMNLGRNTQTSMSAHAFLIEHFETPVEKEQQRAGAKRLQTGVNLPALKGTPKTLSV